MPSPAQAKQIHRLLLQWFDKEKRTLPWRHCGDPYKILVSEFMLQQTQVSTAIPYFERFVDRFPTLKSLAEAPEQEVLRLWAGLGYYSRAQHLHKAAQAILERYDGVVPQKVGDLLFLPGVGQYVAGAVASMAYNEPVPAVDANVARVLSRLFCLKVNPAAPRDRRLLEDLATTLIPGARPGDFNQALMELGALVCPARQPRCSQCPLYEECGAGQAGNPLEYPPSQKARPLLEVKEACALLERDGRFLLCRRNNAKGRYRNMWEFPTAVTPSAQDGPTALQAWFQEQRGWKVKVGEEWAEIRHQVTHHKICKTVYLCALEKPAKAGPGQEEKFGWFSPVEAADLPLGAPHKKILNLLQENNDFFGPSAAT